MKKIKSILKNTIGIVLLLVLLPIYVTLILTADSTNFISYSYIVGSSLMICILTLVYMLLAIIDNFNISKVYKELKKGVTNYEYFRDKVCDLSPAVLSYCCNEKSNYIDNLIATILNLKLNGFIEFETNSIKTTNKDESLLKKNEVFVLNKIKNAQNVVKDNDIKVLEVFTFDSFKKDWEEQIKEDAIELGVLIKKSLFSDRIAQIIAAYFLIHIALVSLAFELIFTLPFEVIFIFVLNLMSSILLIYFGGISSKIEGNYIQTKYGMEIKGKLLGLKRFIKKFSKLNERNLSELKMWDQYMIYTIIFDIKGSVDSETEKLYEKITSLTV